MVSSSQTTYQRAVEDLRGIKQISRKRTKNKRKSRRTASQHAASTQTLAS